MERILSLGNITKDINVTKNGERTGFGGIIYSAITANKLKWNSTILSRGNKDFDSEIAKLEKIGIRVFLQKDNSSLSMVNDYTGGIRRQKVLAKTELLEFDLKEDFDVVHANPLFHEVTQKTLDDAKKRCEMLLLDVQGLIRQEKNGVVYGEFLNQRESWFENVDILKVGRGEMKFVSKENDYKKVCEDLQSLGPKIVLLTLRKEGSVILANEFYQIPSFQVKEIDSTGAGDVYAASFLIRYFETGNVPESGFFATAAASFCAEGFGPNNIQSKEKVEERCKILRQEVI